MSGASRDARASEQARLEVVERLRSRRSEALEAIATRMLSSTPDRTRMLDVQLTLGWRDVVNACLDCGLLALEQGTEWAGPIPPVVVAQERRAVRNGIGLSLSVASYITAYRLAWDYVLEELGSYSDISDRQRTLVLRQASTATASLLTQILTEVADVHFCELKRTAAHDDARLVGRILSGERVSDCAISYSFDSEHVGVIAWGEGAAKALASVADSLGYQRWIVSNDDGTVWAWLSSCRGCVVEDITKALSNDRYARVFAAIGEPASNMTGFRDTHGLAQGAYLVAQLSKQRVTRYADVAREARALRDPLHARWLMQTYIAPVAGQDDGDMLLRTLEKFYEASRIVDKAAKALDFGRHRVERYLAKVGALIGRELHTCHGDMELALSLAKLYARCGQGVESSS